MILEFWVRSEIEMDSSTTVERSSVETWRGRCSSQFSRGHQRGGPCEITDWLKKGLTDGATFWFSLFSLFYFIIIVLSDPLDDRLPSSESSMNDGMVRSLDREETRNLG